MKNLNDLWKRPKQCLVLLLQTQKDASEVTDM